MQIKIPKASVTGTPPQSLL